MSRSGYSEDYDDQWSLIMYRGAVKSAIRGRKGQTFLKDLVSALDALPEKKLIANDLVQGGAVCAIGAVGLARNVDMQDLDPEDAERVASVFGIAPSLAREIVWENDEARWHANETPEQRFERMRAWAASQIKSA